VTQFETFETISRAATLVDFFSISADCGAGAICVPFLITFIFPFVVMIAVSSFYL
jgi:hypothetical protein